MVTSPALKLVVLVLAALTVTSEGAGPRKPPNIIFMLADDLGWADVERHDPEMSTPTLEKMAKEGRELKYNYVMPTCAPTRSALLTGRYPFTYGMQLNPIHGNKRAWLDERLTLLPATMRTLGYKTHMIGKWHLGFCNKSLTPTGRGFDTFYGFYSGAQGYFNHSGNNRNAFDFRDNDRLVTEAKGHYATELHTTRAQKIIRDASRDGSPFFLYFSYQNVHAPFEAKQRYIDDYCSHVVNETRRTHCAMVAAMDESIANVTRTLENKGMLDNTIMIFMSDNGGPIGGGAFNYPLRGQKSTLWEGGVRSYSVVYSPLLTGPVGQQYEGLIQAVDWYPTIVQAAGGTPPSGLDGLGLWDALRTNNKALSNRTEFIYNIDEVNRRAAMRMGKWKLTEGRPGRKYNGWYPYPSLGKPDEPAPKPWKQMRGYQLFDIDADPREEHNVAKANQPIVDIMVEKLHGQWDRLVLFEDGVTSSKGSSLMRLHHAYTPGWCNPEAERLNKTKA